ncbi:uncharacterized protein LOC143364796 [Halictus rubicundus]|uniref:uncharacterized protein LOC143364796 n=1 Tax=Halictus rubicundus TaxID=77578 RepID=UPI0040372275
MANAIKRNQRIRALKHKQRVFTSNLTNFTTELSEYQDSATARTKLRERIDRLRKQFDAFNDAQDELGQYEDFDQTETERKTVTTAYDDALASAIQLSESFSLTPSQSMRTTTDSPAPSTSNSITGIHLPKINLPRFDGRLEKWLPFKDAFLSLIHGHTGLTDIQRFNYLRLSVSGQAESAIESFTMSEENYKAAWAQLLETYDNQRALVLRHTALLLETPAMPEGTPNSINNLINYMQSHIRSLQSLGRSWEDIANDFITSIAIDRMDHETRRTWEHTLVDTRMPHAAEMFKHLRNASHQSSSQKTTTNAKRIRHALPEIQRPSPNLRSRAPKRTFVTTVHTPGFYLPHHAVIKPTSLTTKVRVVFDGSAKTNTNLSLNDTLRIGPTLQDDLLSPLLRFRMHTYVLTGDIEKMYRQFLIRPEDRIYQRILWRDPHEEIKTYELTTVTFGLASAPYLAIRSLHQLATDEERNFSGAAARIKRDLYVDDLVTGTDSITEAKRLQHQIITLLKKGALNIRQWASNEPKLLSSLSKELIHPKILGDASTMKTLGISWDAQHDTIRYSVQPTTTTEVSKRNILSTIAKMYDPLGVLGPITIIAKIIMQRLWTLKITWDESVPTSIHTERTNFESTLQQLNDIEFKRLVRIKNAKRTELHGFCDASEKAYGACLYIRTTDNSGSIHAHLLCAKSRVAPLSQITLARLELCGAVLLATLSQTVRNALTHNIDKTIFWTDSTVVLGWLKKQPSTLKTFVANRVADIQRKTDIQSWRQVRSTNNPADLISRGTTAVEFNNNHLWRNGPKWLTQEQAKWPPARFARCEELPELRTVTCLVGLITQTDEILMRYSNIQKLRRIVAYCLRFRTKHRASGPLSIKELQDANDRIIRLLQAVTFAHDIRDLKIGRLPNTSNLMPLCPFLDDSGVLRVGGRLQNSTLPFEQRHPTLLPREHHVTKLIIRDSHLRNHHAGITTTLYDVRQLYWPINGKTTTRQIIRQCVRCFRVKPTSVEYVMGNLPAARVTEGRPFINSGIDYCGPFFIKERQFRNRTRVKVYVAVFICFATKAVHLEVVSDLTTEAFIAALKRFIARRGMCKNLYSDNGTNFIGANNELTELHQTLSKDEKFNYFLTSKSISWHFMPALSPHFGGLWEAAVKSFKHHVKRVVGEELFTYEQFTTFVIEIEAILNSRPLTPLSSDPNDISALTPGHFLIGGSLTCITETDFSKSPSNRLSNWQHIQKVKQDFWTRWHKEYIHQLNLRHKWNKGSHNINIGTIVL